MSEEDDLLSGDEESQVAIQKIDFWHISVHVHGKEIHVSCGK